MTTMQRQVLQAACRPGCPDAMRAARISFQTAARARMRDVMRAVDRNRTARVVADRLDGWPPQRHDAPRHDVTDLSRCPASERRRVVGQPRREPGNSRMAPPAHAHRHGFRMRTPSRGCDARCMLQPVFEHTSHPAPCRATRTTPIRVAALAERARAA
ncbi:hypothetical protein NTJ56_17385 [Burkholderia contaminans]|uniref:hypothetical protein n=1 Tax=Burkholderia contaminans TaxID=488447 RepID=UPI001CF506DC|nr:hypothetical protein [Burkholderia contaminans]MCA7919347.1 hypothetical protein [Burkholderia contaminans]UUX37092.1 hypothetical protein NTJ56_17385 [Burkholderia contaminans]